MEQVGLYNDPQGRENIMVSNPLASASVTPKGQIVGVVEWALSDVAMEIASGTDARVHSNGLLMLQGDFYSNAH